MTKKEDLGSAATQPPDQSWEKLDRLDWHLWMLAVLLIFVLGASLLSFMFPSAFWFEEQLALERPQRAFFGFCLLLALVLVYLLQRQAAVRRLKRQLFEAQTVAAAATREATIQSFQTLPGLGQLRDALAMEYRRASTSEKNLAMLVLTAPKASLESLGLMASLPRSLLRPGESLYRFSEKGLGIILPGLELNTAASFARHVEDQLGLPKGELEVAVIAYPEPAASLAEMEHLLRTPQCA